MTYRVTIEEEVDSDEKYNKWNEVYKQEIPDLDIPSIVSFLNSNDSKVLESYTQKIPNTTPVEN